MDCFTNVPRRANELFRHLPRSQFRKPRNGAGNGCRNHLTICSNPSWEAANVRQPTHTTSKDGHVTKRTGILIAVIAALVAGGLAIGLGLMSNSHATEPTTAAHAAATTTPTTSAPRVPPSTTVPPTTVPPTTVPPSPPPPAPAAADNGPSSGATASRCQRHCSGQWRRP